MAIVDDRGRLFGRVNLIDLAVLVFLVALLPLGYGAYLMFRQPTPKITGVTPNRVTYSKGEQSVTVTGEYLRPMLRASLGKADARSFLVERPDSAEMRFIDLPPGTYDLTLFDEAMQVAKSVGALTVVPPPPPTTQTADVRVRFFAIPEVLELMRVGEVDRRTETEAPTPASNARAATITALEPPQPAQGRVTLSLPHIIPDAHLIAAGEVPIHTRIAVLRVPLERTHAGMFYRGAPLRIGGGLAFETSEYAVRAIVLSVTPSQP